MPHYESNVQVTLRPCQAFLINHDSDINEMGRAERDLLRTPSYFENQRCSILDNPFEGNETATKGVSNGYTLQIY